MSVESPPPVNALFRSAPVRTALVSLVPFALAAGQLVNSLVNDFPLVLSIGFAVTMLVFAVVATGHCAAEFRLRRLESDW